MQIRISSEDNAFKKNSRAKVDPQTVKDWFQGEGLPYLNPTPGKPNWLGGDVPFPDNRTFQPPPPLSDIVKSSIYDCYLKASQASVLPKSSKFLLRHPVLPLTTPPESHVQAIRALSEQFGISIGRVEAIIRLKQHEQQYQKGKKIQHAFQKGMESYLGIRQERDRALVSDEKLMSSDINFARQRASEVDREASNTGERAQKAGAARRVWWEMVDDTPNAVRLFIPYGLSPPDGQTLQQPVVPSLVTEGLDKYRTKLAEDQQAHAGVALHVEGRPSPQGKPRSVFTFIDTGAKGPNSPKKTRA
ncbi:hypothetical protein FRC10_005765 [Ceratobasidium sp. 414]|nr:hypothetical protein FRC10_005765 [Ceratobasidium sp. 414]